MVFLLSFLISSSAWGLDVVGAAVEQAQTWAVKKNRAEACSVLRRAIADNPKSAAKIVETLNQLSKVFFTDKGQKAFEAGQAVMFDNPDLAMNEFRRSLELEDNNLVVLTAIARIQVAKQDCRAAVETLTTARKLNPLSGEAAVLELRALLCSENNELLRDRMKSLPLLAKSEEGLVQYITAQDLLLQGQAKKANELLVKVSEENPQFPETYYYLARAGAELKKDVEMWQQKYVSLCKAVTVRERKKFSLEPRLCFALKEVEDELSRKDTEM